VIIAETGMYLNGSPISAAGSSNPGIWYHDLLWSQLGAPSVTWPNYWERNHIEAISGNYWTISKPFAAFVNSLDVAGGGYTDVVSKLTNSNSNIRVFGQVNSTKKTAYLWVQNKNHNWNKSTPAAQSGTIALSGFTANTAYPVEKWDTYAGTFTSQSVTANASGVVTMTVSGLTTDLAYKIGTMGGSTTGTPTPTPVIKAGDANGDGVVDKNDYAIWLSHYLQSVSGRSNGDFNNDATVNGADYYIWYKNYGL